MKAENIRETILSVTGLKKYFPSGRSVLKAVDGVTFSVGRGETVGIVGESGCGKTTCARTCIGIYRPTAGTVLYKGSNIHTLKGRAKKSLTKEIQMIFQDPYGSLDPRMKVGTLIAEGMKAHRMCATERDYLDRVCELLGQVGLPAEHAGRYIHEFSGGQRQRIGIARALAVEPELIVCDEPISALDVSIQAQIINLLSDLKERRGLTYLFIAHDLSMIKYFSDRVIVMYLGTVAEITSASELYSDPAHPYTRALLSAIPLPDPDAEARRRRIRLSGEVHGPVDPPPGCRFRFRCPDADARCARSAPSLREIAPGHWAACFRLE